MMIPTLTSNPVEFGRALARIRHRERVKRKHRLELVAFRRRLRRFRLTFGFLFRPRAGSPD